MALVQVRSCTAAVAQELARMASVNFTFVFVFFQVLVLAHTYEVPAPLIEALSPRGLRISIPGKQMSALKRNTNVFGKASD